MHFSEHNFIQTLSYFLHYFCFVYVIFVMLITFFNLYFIDKNKDKDVVKKNYITSRYILDGMNYITIFIGFVILIILVLGLIQRFHHLNLDIFNETELRNLLYIGLPIILCFFIIAVINIAFIIFFIIAIKHEDTSFSDKNILYKPHLHIFFTILSLIMTLGYIAFFTFSIGMKLYHK